jgi:hypothetical protein
MSLGQTIVTGAFTSQRGVRDGPVTFDAGNILYQSLEHYGETVPTHAKTAAFQAAYDAFSEMNKRWVV